VTEELEFDFKQIPNIFVFLVASRLCPGFKDSLIRWMLGDVLWRAGVKWPECKADCLGFFRLVPGTNWGHF